MRKIVFLQMQALEKQVPIIKGVPAVIIFLLLRAGTNSSI